MIDLTDHLLDTAPGLDAVFRAAVDEFQSATRLRRPSADYAILAGVRARHGFMAIPAPLLTPPKANVKLKKGKVPSYGLTLAHFRLKLPAARVTIGRLQVTMPALSVNACPNAGHCTRVCVLDNGNGRYESTQRGRNWKSDLLARHPESFARILAFELVRAVRKHGSILFRPNVNSDIAWEDVLPSLADGYVRGVVSYGYSKRPETLERDGWLGSHYRVAFSWNEQADAEAVRAFHARGGAVAAVTGRKKGAPTVREFPFGTHDAVDADKTDEWMLTSGAVVGDLSAKGKARNLIGKSQFVVAA